MNTWKPTSRQEIAEIISDAESKMIPGAKQLWEFIKLPKPEKWEQNPMGNEGGGFWVVAVMGSCCLYYNDIEDGFNESPFDKWGVINDYQCDQNELQDIFNYFVSEYIQNKQSS